MAAVMLAILACFAGAIACVFAVAHDNERAWRYALASVFLVLFTVAMLQLESVIRGMSSNLG